MMSLWWMWLSTLVLACCCWGMSLPLFPYAIASTSPTCDRKEARTNVRYYSWFLAKEFLYENAFTNTVPSTCLQLDCAFCCTFSCGTTLRTRVRACIALFSECLLYIERLNDNALHY